MHGRVWVLLMFAVCLTWHRAEALAPDQWVLGDPGQRCSNVCSGIGMLCDADAQTLTTDAAVTAAFAEVGVDCSTHPIEYRSTIGVPLQHSASHVNCYGVNPGSTSTCDQDHTICTNGSCRHLCRCVNPVPIAPVYSLPPTTKQDQYVWITDDFVDLMTTPIQFQAETNGGMTVLGRFFFEPNELSNAWNYFFQIWNFNLVTPGELHLQVMLYRSNDDINYRMSIWKDGTSCQGEFARPTTENIWYTVEFQYSTVTDSWYLNLNDVTVTQNTCSAGFLQNIEWNRVSVAHQNWAGLRLYDSLLTDAEVASELNEICVPADECADVLTAGCDSPTAALCLASTPGPDPKDSKPASSAYHIDGGGWKLVRRVKAGSTWHPATDWLAGTDEYGTYTTDETIDDTFSIRYDHMILGNIDFLFATGDGSYWLIATREQIGGVQLGFSDYSSSPDYTRTFTSSTGKTSAVWYNRQAFNKDPMISQNDWGSDPLYMMYRGASVPEHTELGLNHNGMNVFVRTSYNDAEASNNCQDIPPTSKFSFEEGLLDETGNAEIQKIAGTGSTFVSDATHGQVLNVHHNLYRIDSATLGAMLDANAFTVSFWIRLKEFGSDVINANLLLSRYDWNVGDNRGGFILWINAKKIALKQYYGPNTTPHEVESTQELSILDNWYHIMLVKVSSTESKIFIDGTLDNSFTFSPAAKSMHNPMDVIGLGAYCYGNTGNADGYSCAVGSSYDDNSKYYMNDLRFYDFAASDTQVAAIANGGDISTCSETTDVPCCSRTWPD